MAVNVSNKTTVAEELALLKSEIKELKKRVKELEQRPTSYNPFIRAK